MEVDLAEWLDLFGPGLNSKGFPDFVEAQEHFRHLGTGFQREEYVVDSEYSSARPQSMPTQRIQPSEPCGRLEVIRPAS